MSKDGPISMRVKGLSERVISNHHILLPFFLDTPDPYRYTFVVGKRVLITNNNEKRR